MKKGLKIILCALMAVMLVGSLAGCSKDSDKVTINVYNWGDYIDMSIISDFEKEYDIKVNYEMYETNESMYQKLKSGGISYDVIIPSDYMISKLVNEDMLNKINFDNVPNYKYIGEDFKGLEYDPNDEYSVPYAWGTVGILYNKNIVDDKVDSWNILWDKKYKKQIIMQDSQRETLGVALQRLGYSLNTNSVDELQEAKQSLIEQKPLVLAYVVDEVKDKMINEEAGLAVVWAGDAMQIIAENPNLDYVVPKEGSNFFVDAVAIPKTAKHQKEAEMFINYLNRPEVAAKNIEYIMYSTPNTEAKKLLPTEVSSSKIAYPSSDVLANCHVYLDLGDKIKLYDRIWTEIKAAK